MSIDPKKHNCEIKMTCPVCGNTEFETKGNSEKAKCVSCEKEFTKDELIKANEKSINAKQLEIANEIINDAKKEFTDFLKKFK